MARIKEAAVNLKLTVREQLCHDGAQPLYTWYIHNTVQVLSKAMLSWASGTTTLEVG